MVLAVRSSPKTASKVIFVGIFGGRASYIESSDENLEEWSKPIDIQVPQEALDADYWIFWDPDAWVEGDYYYVYSGSHAGHPFDKRPGSGSWYKEPTLMRSKDFKNWEFLGKFMTKDLPRLDRQDYSCTDFFKLGHKQMKLLISHSWGARYYLGEWKDNKFTPDFHAKMSWSWNPDKEPVYWAPKTLSHTRWAQSSHDPAKGQAWQHIMECDILIALGVESTR